MSDNNSVITGSSSTDTAITDVVLDVADNGTHGNGWEGKHIPDHEIGLLTTLQELAGVQTLGGDEELLLVLEPKGCRKVTFASGAPRPGSWMMPVTTPAPLPEVEGPEPCRAIGGCGSGTPTKLLYAVRESHGPFPGKGSSFTSPPSSPIRRRWRVMWGKKTIVFMFLCFYLGFWNSSILLFFRRKGSMFKTIAKLPSLNRLD